MKSNCCNAAMQPSCGDIKGVYTNFYYCLLCGKPCDEKIPEKKIIKIEEISEDKIRLSECTEEKYNGLWIRHPMDNKNES